MLTHHVYDEIVSFHCIYFCSELLLFPYFTTDSHRQTPTDRVIFTVFTTYFTLRYLRGEAEFGLKHAPF